MAKRRRRTSRSDAEAEQVLAGVARRMAEVIALIRAGQWKAPQSWELPEDDPPPDDEGGLAASGVRRKPPDKSGSGSVGLPEPDD